MAKPFQKFYDQEPTGAKKREQFRQEKRRARAERQEAGDAFRKRKEDKERGIPTDSRPFKAGRKPFESNSERPRRNEAREGNRNTREIKPFQRRSREVAEDKFEPKDRREAPTSKDRGEEATSNNSQSRDKVSDRSSRERPKTGKKYIRSNSDKYFIDKEKVGKIEEGEENPDLMPLNKYVAHSGICGRREAAGLVKLGHVTVNGDVIFEPGFKVKPTDTVVYKGNKLTIQKNLVYVLLNKPKDFITTTNDPEGRKTVLDLVKAATHERIYPIGRLDRNTTGVLLLTNDGELAQKLTHPSYEIKKIYEAKLDKPLTQAHYDEILKGITLDDGPIKVDNLGYADSKDKSVIGIEIHSGRNRVVRRIFEHLGYDVKNLDRVMFANLTKKGVERAKWRLLSENEVRLLKYLSPQAKTTPIPRTRNKSNEEGD